MLIYARVDIIEDHYDNPALSELELIEPELWFRHCSEAAPKMAAAVMKHLQSFRKI